MLRGCVPASFPAVPPKPGVTGQGEERRGKDRVQEPWGEAGSAGLRYLCRSVRPLQVD